VIKYDVFNISHLSNVRV